jgi:hypothetical protein
MRLPDDGAAKVTVQRQFHGFVRVRDDHIHQVINTKPNKLPRYSL